jgi:mannose/cellobiose epimerase-like protein (N-acyl-D-glucosamine 2-epimerase family)
MAGSGVRPHPARWLFEEAMPFWVRHALDERHGGFFTRLSADGEPYRDDPKSTLVQGRMLFACAHAALSGGGDDCLRGARAAFGFLTERLSDPHGGFVRAVAADGAADGPGADSTKDTYDHAFVLLGLATFYRLDPSTELAAWIDRTWAYLQETLFDPSTGGYHEDSRVATPGTPYPLPRRQNPHMHLFEALLALNEATGERAWLDHAGRILAVFRKHLVDRGTGTIREFLGRDLDPAPPPGGLVREPGHHFEWVWLLRRYAVLSGDTSVEDDAAALYRFGVLHGRNPTGPFAGSVYDAVTPAGGELESTMLLWPQTEGVKAHLARFEATGNVAHLDDARRLAELIFEVYVSRERPVWRNQIDTRGKTLQADALTRLLYHVVVFVTEGIRLGVWPDRD